MINWLDATAADFERELTSFRQTAAAHDVEKTVATIIQQVRQEGDKALLELTAKFDGTSLPAAAALWVSPERVAAALQEISPELSNALHDAANRIRNYHQQQKPQSWQSADDAGNVTGERITPMARAAVYVPGGTASYPSSALMGVIPAKVAGVAEVILVTPSANGCVASVTLAAAAIAGADHILMLGGAQAVAALALGTESIKAADVIVGPGNAYVAEAKRQLYGRVGIDSLAGPSEVLIISDSAANPNWVAADILAQAEHDTDAQCIVLSPDAAHLKQVEIALKTQIPRQPRADIIAQSLMARGALITVSDMEQCCKIANKIAAEHVQVMCANAAAVAARIVNAGGIFIGEYSCVAFGDYGAGPNHILPTAGTARFASPLGVENFIKRAGLLQVSAAGAEALALTTAILAESEGLSAHAASAKRRLDRVDKLNSGD